MTTEQTPEQREEAQIAFLTWLERGGIDLQRFEDVLNKSTLPKWWLHSGDVTLPEHDKLAMFRAMSKTKRDAILLWFFFKNFVDRLPITIDEYTGETLYV